VTGLFDTSVVLGPASEMLPEEGAISVITLAELRVGVLVAPTPTDAAARLERLLELERTYDAIPVDAEVAAAFGTIVAAERTRGRKPRPLDALIAATALARGLTLYTRDRDLAGMRSLPVKLLE
jgi:hypothetical protein